MGRAMVNYIMTFESQLNSILGQYAEKLSPKFK